MLVQRRLLRKLRLLPVHKVERFFTSTKKFSMISISPSSHGSIGAKRSLPSGRTADVRAPDVETTWPRYFVER
jgi:hypothetical protein